MLFFPLHCFPLFLSFPSEQLNLKIVQTPATPLTSKTLKINLMTFKFFVSQINNGALSGLGFFQHKIAFSLSFSPILSLSHTHTQTYSLVLSLSLSSAKFNSRFKLCPSNSCVEFCYKHEIMLSAHKLNSIEKRLA